MKGEQKTGYSVKKFIYKTFGYDPSFGTIFPHLDKMIEDGIIARVDDTLLVRPRGKVKYNMLLDELLLIQSKLTPEIFTMDLKTISDRLSKVEEFQKRQRDALNPPEKDTPPPKIIFKKTKTPVRKVEPEIVAKRSVAEEIQNLPGHSLPKTFAEPYELQPKPPPIAVEPIDYNKLSPEQRRAVQAQDAAEKVAEIPKEIFTGRGSFNIDRIEESADDVAE